MEWAKKRLNILNPPWHLHPPIFYIFQNTRYLFQLWMDYVFYPSCGTVPLYSKIWSVTGKYELIFTQIFSRISLLNRWWGLVNNFFQYVTPPRASIMNGCRLNFQELFSYLRYGECMQFFVERVRPVRREKPVRVQVLPQGLSYM